MKKIFFIVALVITTAVYAAFISSYPNTATLQSTDLFIIERPGVTNLNISAAQLPGAMGLGSAAFQATGAFDASGAGTTAATLATNGMSLASGLAAFRPTNTFATTNFATTSAPGLILPDGISLTIDPTTKKLSAVSGGTGTLTGPGSITSGDIATWATTTSLADSGHALSEYAPLTLIANGSQNGLLSLSDWTTFNGKQSALGYVPPTFVQVTQAILSLTLPLDGLAGPDTNFFLVGTATNVVQGQIGTGLKWTNLGPGTNRLDVTVTGGSVTALPATNLWPANTNIVVIDPKLSRTWNIGLITNTWLRFTNTSDLTNFPNEMVINTHQDTNGTWKLLGLDAVGGIVKTNIGAAFGVTTNATAEDQILCRLDWSGTNVYCKIQTNIGPQTASTNSLATGGGGGGGGSFTLLAHTIKQGTSGTTTTTAIDATGAKFIHVSVSYGGGSLPTLSSTPANTWTTVTNTTSGGGNPRIISFRCITPTVSSSMTFQVANIGGTSIGVQAWDAPSTPTAGDISDSGQSGTGGQTTGNWTTTATKPGSITPHNPSVLIVSAGCDVSATSVTPDSGFTQSDAPVFNAQGLWMGYKVKANTTAENPAMTANAAADAISHMAEYH